MLFPLRVADIEEFYVALPLLISLDDVVLAVDYKTLDYLVDEALGNISSYYYSCD